MNTKTTFLRLFAIAAIAAISFTACKKTSGDVIKADDNVVTVVNARTANPAQGARVSITRQQLNQLKIEKKMKLIQTGENTFTVANPGGETGQVGRFGGISEPIGGGNCPPVSEKTLQYYQDEANACCCSFAVCLLGEDCYFYFYYFGPNNGCTGGGNEM